MDLPNAEQINFMELDPVARKKCFRQRLRNFMQTTDAQLKAHQKKYKENFEKLVKERDVDLKVGDLIFLRRNTPYGNDTDDIEAKHRHMNEDKLRSKAIGPYKIENLTSHTVTTSQDLVS